MRPWVLACAVSAAVLFAASGAWAQAFGGLYVHSGALAKQADDADTAANAAADLKPYDDQLAYLQTLAGQEDAANAKLIVARRDEDLVGLIAVEPADRIGALRAAACARLDALVAAHPQTHGGPAPICGDPAKLQKLAVLADYVDNLLRAQRDDDVVVASDIARIAREDPNAKPATCAAPPAEAPEGFATVCGAKAQVAGFLAKAVGPANGVEAGSLIDTTHAEATAAAKTADPSRPTAALEAEIKAVAAAAKKGDLKSLDGFSAQVATAVKDLDPVLKGVSLKHLQGQIDQMSLGVSCAVQTGAGAGTAAAATGDCKSLGPAAQRAEAVNGLLRALAAEADTASARVKSARWLAAANAIVTAYKTDADLQAAADKAAAAAAGLRAGFMVKEASLLATTVILVDGGPVRLPDGSGDYIPKCPGTDRSSCALAYYLASWNEGRAPVQVLAYRKLQAYRETAVKRQRAAAAEEQALMLVGTGALKAYADGGLDPNVFAQLLVGAGLIGTATK